MNLAQCETFVAVVDTGSFTRAADARRISQSAVSHAIRSLETELGVPLMRRDRSGIELTSMGRRLLTHARSMVHHAELMRQEAELAGRERGTLRIAVTRRFDPHLLARTMAIFQKRFPGFDLRLSEGTDRRISDWLYNGQADIGILGSAERRLKLIPLIEEELQVVLPSRHSMAGERTLRFEQILDEPLILHADAVCPLERFCTAGYSVDDLALLLALVAEGHGIALLPGSIGRSLPPALRMVPLTPAITHRLAMALSSSAGDYPAAKGFVSIAQDVTRPAVPEGRSRIA